MPKKQTYADLLEENRALKTALANAQILEKKLRHSEKRWNEVIDFLPDAMLPLIPREE